LSKRPQMIRASGRCRARDPELLERAAAFSCCMIQKAEKKTGIKLDVGDGRGKGKRRDWRGGV
jgi:hypothetical protein